jgi:hypothetical protein
MKNGDSDEMAMRNDIQNRLAEEWTQIQEDHLQHDREEERRFCYKMTHSDG